MSKEAEISENNATPVADVSKDNKNDTGGMDSARKALVGRRRFSFRHQLFIGFFLVFLFAVGVSGLLLITTNKVEEKLRVLEIVDNYVIEIQQARRFEKNYFLYGTNLSDALENTYRAKDIFDRNSQELMELQKNADQKPISSDINLYEDLLKRLVELDQREIGIHQYEREKNEIELELRKHGQKMVSFAQELMNQEKSALEKALTRSKNIHIYSLGVLLIFILFIAYILAGRILGNIRRFTVYASRIASGDFTPITPTRPFRDEFTDLAISINQMMQELEDREAILIQSHKMRAVGTLTAGVAHELNNPLNNLTLTAHMLLEDYDVLSDQERREMIQDIVSESKRSTNIISNLLDFARESGSQLEPLDLKQLLKDTINLAVNQIKLSGIRIEFQATDNLPRVHGDSQQLRQVFLNLILNAIDASSKGGIIRVIVLPADEPNYIAVKVIDTGTGIPDHILSSIFDPFFTTKGKGKGTGLGLSVSQGIVVKHGGKINVSSRKDQGATFTVTLPVTTIPAEITTEKNS
jgi:two-component system NtrC family sensor kinase